MSAPRVVVLRGLPGSGKSTHARRLAQEAVDADLRAEIVSADIFFERDGAYRFDPAQIGEAHASCLRAFMDHAECCGLALIVVDNTNTTAWECSPYVAVGLARGYDVEIVTISASVEVCLERQTHGVPPHVLREMARTLREERLPPFWKQRTVAG